MLTELDNESETLLPAQTKRKIRLFLSVGAVVAISIIIIVVLAVVLTTHTKTVEPYVPLYDVNDYKVAAQGSMSLPAWDYLEGKIGDHVTYKQNSEAFDRLFLIPRTMTNISKPEYKVNIFGKESSFPIFYAPIGRLKGFSTDGEVEVARAAKRLGVPMVVSYFTTTPLDVIADAYNKAEHDEGVNSPGGLWLNVYLQKNKTRMEEVIKFAEAQGYDALVWTVDRPGEAVGSSVWTLDLPLGVNVIYPQGHDRVYNWERISYFRSLTSMKILLKGVVSAAVAAKAASYGLDGLIVSNHGGRINLDSTLPTIAALPMIVDAVKGSNMTIIMDSGIRRGTDVFKALALGASAVLVGRPMVWGLSVDGERGTHSVMSILRDEFHNAMITAGCGNLDDIREYGSTLIYNKFQMSGSTS